jgi:hypothetical protein
MGAVKCREAEIPEADRARNCAPRDLDHFAGWRDVPPHLAVQRRVELESVLVALQMALNSGRTIVIATSSFVCKFAVFSTGMPVPRTAMLEKDKTLYVAPRLSIRQTSKMLRR